MIQANFEEKFSPHQAAIDAFFKLSLHYLPTITPVKIIDVGCAFGTQLNMFAAHLGEGEYVGIDISAKNIAKAEMNQISCEGCDFNWIEGDYLATQKNNASIIISASTIQLIETDDDTLAMKLADDLLPGGRLFITMPYECLYNRALNILRSIMKMLRNKWADKLILHFAKKMHPEIKSDDFIEDRIIYMYMPIKRMDGLGLRNRMKAVGLDCIYETPIKHESLAQPKHKFLVFSKTEANQ